MSGTYSQLPNNPNYVLVQPQEYYNVPQYQGSSQQQQNPILSPKKEMSNDSITALILFGLGFIVCLTWPICYCLYRNSRDDLAKVLAKVSLLITIVSIILPLAVTTFCFFYIAIGLFIEYGIF